MGNREWISRNKILTLVVLVLAIILIILGNLFRWALDNIQPVSPLKMQAVEDTTNELNHLQSLDGQMEWYGDIPTWSPDNSYVVYPIITRTLHIYWSDEQAGIAPAVLFDATANLTIELELRSGGSMVHSETITTVISPLPPEPDQIKFRDYDITLIDKPGGDFEMWVQVYWLVSDGSVYFLQLVEDGEIIETDSR